MLKPEKDRFVIAILQHLAAEGPTAVRDLCEDLDLSYWTAHRAVSVARHWELVRTAPVMAPSSLLWLVPGLALFDETKFLITNAGRHALQNLHKLDPSAPFAACE